MVQIIRGILLGLALMMYGQEEGSDGLTESMIRDQDPILRYGSLQTLQLSFMNTSNLSSLTGLH